MSGKKLTRTTQAQLRAREFQHDSDLPFIKGVVARRNVEMWDKLHQISSVDLLAAIDKEIIDRHAAKQLEIDSPRIRVA